MTSHKLYLNLHIDIFCFFFLSIDLKRLPGDLDIFIHPDVDDNPTEAKVRETLETIRKISDTGVWYLEGILQAAHLIVPLSAPLQNEVGIASKKRRRPSKAEEQLADAQVTLTNALEVQREKRLNVEEKKKALEDVEEKLRQVRELQNGNNEHMQEENEEENEENEEGKLRCFQTL